MRDEKLSRCGRSSSEQALNLEDALVIGGVRNDLHTMLLPMFPDRSDGAIFETEMDGCAISMRTTDSQGRIATAGDRKLLNLLSAHVRDVIRTGGAPSRHILVDVLEVLDLVSGDDAGGTDYARVTERLQRLHATKIVAERSIAPGVSRRREFNWIDAFEQDVEHTPGGKKITRLKISLSEDAFRWITTNEGFDLSRDRFRSITSSRTSSWRIFEICLATLVKSSASEVFIQIDELRRRVPITDHLRGFKSRTLKLAMKAIAENPDMARYLRLDLTHQTDEGYEILRSGKRVALDTIYVRVRQGEAPLPSLSTLLPTDCPAEQIQADPASAVGAFADLLSDPGGQILLFQKGKDM